MTSNMRCFFVFCFACINIVCALAVYAVYAFISVVVVVVFLFFFWGGGLTLFYYNMPLRCITVTYVF